MIIQVRGTSGSGKTWVMRQVMKLYGPWEPFYVVGRRKPYFYTNQSDIAVLGHYESVCGGCDNIGSSPEIYEAIQYCPAQVILCEGLLLGEDFNWTTKMEEPRVIFLHTPIPKCLEQIEQRRAEAGKDKTFDRIKVQTRHNSIDRCRERLESAGVECRRASSNQAVRIIQTWIDMQIKNPQAITHKRV